MIKIDRSFVAGMLGEPGDWALVTNIIRLAHDLRCRVVAEGVETVAQADALIELGCDELQGYLFGKPAPEPRFQSHEQPAAVSADGQA